MYHDYHNVPSYGMYPVCMSGAPPGVFEPVLLPRNLRCVVASTLALTLSERRTVLHTRSRSSAQRIINERETP